MTTRPSNRLRFVLVSLGAALAVAGGTEASPPAGKGAPTTCEVELSGHLKVKGPKLPAGAASPLTFVALGDCMAPSPRVVGFSGSTRGRFFVEVFVPEGSELTLCAALESTPGGPSTLYGKAARTMVAHGRGEVEFKNLVVELAPGPARTFPHTVGMR